MSSKWQRTVRKLLLGNPDGTNVRRAEAATTEPESAQEIRGVTTPELMSGQQEGPSEGGNPGVKRPRPPSPEPPEEMETEQANTEEEVNSLKRDLHQLRQEMAQLLRAQLAASSPGFGAAPGPSNSQGPAPAATQQGPTPSTTFGNFMGQSASSGPVPKVSKPPPFEIIKGEEMDANAWMFEFKNFLVASRVPPAEWLPVVVTFLKGGVNTWWRMEVQSRQSSNLPSHTWTEFERLFKNRFQMINKDRRLRDKLFQLRQTQGVIPYIRAFEEIVLEIDPPMSEADKVHTFVRGLKPNVRLEVEKAHSTLDQYDEVIRIAERMDATLFSNRMASMDQSRSRDKDVRRPYRANVIRQQGMSGVTSAKKCYHCHMVNPTHSNLMCFQNPNRPVVPGNGRGRGRAK